MNMKEVFEICFERLIKSNLEEYGTYPTEVCEEEEIYTNPLFIPDTIDEDGYAQWKPVVQNVKVDFKKIQSKLGITLNQTLKDYFTSYWFCDLAGKANEEIYLYFTRIPYNSNIEALIMESYVNPDVMKNTEFKDTQLFTIGYADIEGNDEYMIMLDNNTGKISYVCFDGDEILIENTNKTLEEIMLSLEEVF